MSSESTLCFHRVVEQTAASSLALVEVEQFGGARQRVDHVADRQLIEVEPTVAGTNPGDQIDVAESLGVGRRVGGQSLGFADRIRPRVVMGIDDVHRQALADFAHEEEVWKKPRQMLPSRQGTQNQPSRSPLRSHPTVAGLVVSGITLAVSQPVSGGTPRRWTSPAAVP